MESWLKALIAVACLVIIGGGAYFGLGEYRASAKAGMDHARAAETERCTQIWRDYLKPGGGSVDNQTRAADCLISGAFTKAEVEALKP